jgi:hypothetical protein
MLLVLLSCNACTLHMHVTAPSMQRQISPGNNLGSVFKPVVLLCKRLCAQYSEWHSQCGMRIWCTCDDCERSGSNLWKSPHTASPTFARYSIARFTAPEHFCCWHGLVWEMANYLASIEVSTIPYVTLIGQLDTARFEVAMAVTVIHNMASLKFVMHAWNSSPICHLIFTLHLGKYGFLLGLICWFVRNMLHRNSYFHL